MRRDLNKPYVPWTVRITPEDRTALDELLPAQGMKTWVVVKSLGAFLDLMEGSKGLQRWAHREIQSYIYREGEGRLAYRDLNAQIPTELYVRFSKVFPEFGAASWVMRRIIHQIINDMREDGFSFEERIEASVNRAMTPSQEEETAAHE